MIPLEIVLFATQREFWRKPCVLRGGNSFTWPYFECLVIGLVFHVCQSIVFLQKMVINQ